MGVQGLWSILNCCGKDIDLNTLEGKILAIDLSIWLNQALKSPNESPNAHLEILFNRICKLFYYKIKPVFVFDGPTPTIKRYAHEIRRKLKQKQNDRTEQIRSNIINILMKKRIIQKRKTMTIKEKESSDIFQLDNDKSEWMHNWNPSFDSQFSDIAMDYIAHFSSIDDVDVESNSFQVLPLEVQHEVLRTVSKEKRYGLDRYQNSYNDLNLDDFSGIQIQRLLNRNHLNQRVDNLKSSMNYRDCRKVIQSSKLSSLADWSTTTISAKKVMSQNQGYLMLIDPSNTELINSLSESKKKTTTNQAKRKFENNDTDKSIEHKSDEDSSEESENLLNAEDLSSIMKCVSKIKNNNQEEKEYLYNKEQPQTDIKQKQCVLLTQEEYLKEKCTLENIEKVLQNDVIEINNIKDINVSVIEIENGNNKDALSEKSVSPIIKYSDKDESGEGSNSESGDDFIDVPDLEDHNLDPCEINEVDIERDAELESEKNTQNLIFSLIQKELKESKLNSLDEVANKQILCDLNTLDSSLSKLYDEEKKLENQSTTVTEHYFQEAKELLRLFGIPFIESPAEAEAQCAFLETIGLTDGTITEDSDIWLFGGKTVYKHMFTRGFSVKEYSSNHIYKKLGLNRNLMICIALLSGGDYTPGIYGVGPVNAMEILAEFSDLDVPMSDFDVLKSFKNWYEKHKDDLNYSGNPIRKRFLKFELDNNFPDPKVYEAYNKPLVDESREPFYWSTPSTDKLIEFVHLKIGWKKLKIIEILEGAFKTHSALSQKRITDFFIDPGSNSKKTPSKRLKEAALQRNLIVKNSCCEQK